MADGDESYSGIPGAVAPACTDLEVVPTALRLVEPKRTTVFDLFIAGHTIDYAAQVLGVPYIDAQREVEEQLAKRTVERKLMPEKEAAVLDAMQIALMPAALAGDTDAVREIRHGSESRRKIFGTDAPAQRDADAGVVVIAFNFGPRTERAPEADIPVARIVGRSEAHDLGPASDPVDRDGNEDGENGSGGGLDQRGDRQG